MYVTINPVCWDEYGKEIDHLTQWDKNQRLVLEYSPVEEIIAPPYIDFCNQATDDEAIRIQSEIEDEKIIANIPNELLTQPYPIFAYVRMSDNASDRNTSVKSVCIVKIPITEARKPADYVFDNPHVSVTLDDVNSLAKKNENGIRMILQAQVNGLHYCGTITYDSLPNDAVAGDYYQCTDRENKYYAWNGLMWHELETFTLEHFRDVQRLAGETNKHMSEALNAQLAAENAKTGAEAAKAAAATAQLAAEQAELNAKNSQDAAKLSELNAKESETNAAKSESGAKFHLEDASKHAASADNAKIAAEEYAASAKSAVDNAKEFADNAQNSAVLAQEIYDKMIVDIQDMANRLNKLEEISIPQIGDIVANTTGIDPSAIYVGTVWEKLPGSSEIYHVWKRVS